MKPFEIQTQHPDPMVAEAALLLQQFAEQLEAGEMTNEEYKQLTYDLLDMQHIDKLAMELNRKVEIAKAFQQLLQIAGLIGKFI
jgi:hypothetical protein